MSTERKYLTATKYFHSIKKERKKTKNKARAWKGKVRYLYTQGSCMHRCGNHEKPYCDDLEAF
jgi:hypothetical protein